jgi:hypothetical protein
MRRRQFLGGLVAGAAWCGGGRAARAAVACDYYPQVPGWDFLVLRQGDAIGAHRFSFSRRDGDFVVEVAIDIAVSLLGMTVFRYTHRSRETWRDGWLHGLVSATDDNGNQVRIAAERSGGALRGHVNDVGFDVSGFIVPSSLWHRDTRQSRALFSTIEGRMKVVNIAALGPEEVEAGGARVGAEHYRITGELERDIWYGPACDIARVTFPAGDGSLITLARQ